MAIKIGGTTIINDYKQIGNIGIATIGFATITNAYVGVLTVRSLFVEAGTYTAPPVPTSYSPGIGETTVSADVNISVVFNQSLGRGSSGNISVRDGSAVGVAVTSIGIGSTSQISVTGNTVVINPTNNLNLIGGRNYYVVFDAGVVVSSGSSIGNEPITNYYFSTRSIAPTTFSPGIGSTGINGESNIRLVFPRSVTKGTGNITIRKDSSGGIGVQTIGVTSTAVLVTGDTVDIELNDLSLRPQLYYAIIDSGVFLDSNTLVGNELISNYYFTTKLLGPGDASGGGQVICTTGTGTAWIVAPATAEVTRCQLSNADANTRAQTVTGKTGWFVPDVNQVYNPGYVCRSYWDSYTCADYWSSTGAFWYAYTNYRAYRINMSTGSVTLEVGSGYQYGDQTTELCRIRSMRCLIY